MIRNFFVVIIVLIASGAYAQKGSPSPYSFFGIGDLQFKGSVENQMMGGISIYGDSIHINLQNPAAYGKLKLTAYTAGATYKSLTIENATESESLKSTTLDYLALAFPITPKMGVGIGLMPYSSIGYQLSTINDSETIANTYTGEGGVNKFFVSLGYQINKEFSVGATLNYNFGNLENNKLQREQNVHLGTRTENISDISGFDFNLAINYNKKMGDKYTLYSSLLISPEINLTSKNERNIASVLFNNGNQVDREVINVDLIASGLNRTDLTMPLSTTVGLGFGEERKWFLGTEIRYKQLSNFKNNFVNVANVAYEDATEFALGGFYLPKYNSFGKYFNRVTYRAGLRYGNSGMVINGEQINNFGMSFGVGLPLSSAFPPSVQAKLYANLFSNLNIGFEYGKRGTTNQGLVEEDYFSVKIGLSFNDGWFVKRKIN